MYVKNALFQFLAPSMLLGISAHLLQSASAQNPGPPVPSAVPPNASRVTAVVRAQKVWPPGSLRNSHPIVAAGVTLWSLQLELLSAVEAEAGSANLARVGSTLEAFSDHAIDAQLVGKKIAATLRLTGNTDGTRWMIQDFKQLP